MRVEGRCHRGFVTYEAEVNVAEISVCHCADCQRLTGSAYRITASVPAEAFRLTGGEPKLYTRFGDNGRGRDQFFCPHRGSPIYTTGEGEDAKWVGIRVGTIDQRRALRPSSQIWCASALPWIDHLSKIPRRQGD
ncbi:GFA family protein [Amaricoccus solimangrovi]|uniref:GFA family protein n=1 Tax=Amaricoccus solimangrovi TaxID=2589815 RepID=A0A501W8I8_9RHOB|nr:GFA family protein [Amaricoccus solimangrovi]TPE45668.1 GFA family protein [Amaricoccus solimangrovi]